MYEQVASFASSSTLYGVLGDCRRIRYFGRLSLRGASGRNLSGLPIQTMLGNLQRPSKKAGTRPQCPSQPTNRRLSKVNDGQRQRAGKRKGQYKVDNTMYSKAKAKSKTPQLLLETLSNTNFLTNQTWLTKSQVFTR